MAGHGGGAWKVAYADFVTAMMAFFLVMWITGQSKPVKQAVAQYFEDPLGMNRGSRSTSLKGPEDSTTIGPYQSGRGPARGLAMADNKSDAPRNPRGTAAKHPPKVIIHRHQTRTRSVGITVPFADDSADLDDRARGRLDDVLPMLLGKPNKVEIRVYTPRQPLKAESPYRDTWELCHARCIATLKYLVEKGIDSDRIRLSQDGEPEPFTAPTDPNGEPEVFPVEVFLSDEHVHRGE
ncbi:MAG: OmpA family protein [Planctomycetia bacterium]|nr:OmpA family protein [Planctomycetia bacterium]